MDKNILNLSTLSCYHCQRNISHYVAVLTVNFNYSVFMCIRGSKNKPQTLYAAQLL